MKRALALAVLVLAAGCKPPSVVALDQWLDAYGQDDTERMVANTWSGDRPVLREALEALRTAPTSTLAMALPPRPLSYELVEIETKAPGRQVVLTTITMKNPMAYASERVGHVLPDIPKTRPERRRFLMIQEGEAWGVKLDLAAAVARVDFAAAFERRLAARDLAGAAKMLEAVPPPPDEANAMKSHDRLAEALQERLQKAEARTRTATVTR
ncbi:MAG: hypothetical protein H6730_36915 [Deltaproteobacteria bacterium]|nr:hypothetical protein [Deltaproteobacteria bacterium]